jgi:glycosyltransferase involved in cell wall biosynthesis
MQEPPLQLIQGEQIIREICIVVASNDTACLQRNLLVSDMIARQGVPVHVERGAPSASVAYNRGIDATDAPIVIFAHQDVYFPPGWENRLAAAISTLQATDPDWALLAPFGMAEETATHRGDVWTTSLSRRVGVPATAPVMAQSFDELVIVLRRASGLRFDEGLPLFHLYGTDIVQMARVAGKGAYIADLPVVHNDGFHDRLRADFTAGYDYIRRKWRARLPLRTPVLWVTRHGFALWIYRLRAARSLERRRAVAGDTGTDPRVYAAASGWE